MKKRAILLIAVIATSPKTYTMDEDIPTQAMILIGGGSITASLVNVCEHRPLTPAWHKTTCILAGLGTALTVKGTLNPNFSTNPDLAATGYALLAGAATSFLYWGFRVPQRVRAYYKTLRTLEANPLKHQLEECREQDLSTFEEKIAQGASSKNKECPLLAAVQDLENYETDLKATHDECIRLQPSLSRPEDLDEDKTFLREKIAQASSVLAQVKDGNRFKKEAALAEQQRLEQQTAEKLEKAKKFSLLSPMTWIFGKA